MNAFDRISSLQITNWVLTPLIISLQAVSNILEFPLVEGVYSGECALVSCVEQCFFQPNCSFTNAHSGDSEEGGHIITKIHFRNL